MGAMIYIRSQSGLKVLVNFQDFVSQWLCNSCVRDCVLLYTCHWAKCPLKTRTIRLEVYYSVAWWQLTPSLYIWNCPDLVFRGKIPGESENQRD